MTPLCASAGLRDTAASGNLSRSVCYSVCSTFTQAPTFSRPSSLGPISLSRGCAIFTLPPVRSSELAAACKMRDKLEALLGITKALKPYSRLRRRSTPPRNCTIKLRGIRPTRAPDHIASTEMCFLPSRTLDIVIYYLVIPPPSPSRDYQSFAAVGEVDCPEILSSEVIF